MAFIFSARRATAAAVRSDAEGIVIEQRCWNIVLFELLLRHGIAEGVSLQSAAPIVRCEVGRAVFGAHCRTLVGNSCAVVDRGLSVVAGLLRMILALIDRKLDVALLEHLLLEVFFPLLAVALDALGCSSLDIVVAWVWTSLIT